MPWIKAADIAYGRFRAPDLDVMEEFLTRFGLVRSDRTATALYMRGTDPPHHLHITEMGIQEPCNPLDSSDRLITLMMVRVRVVSM